MASNETVLYLHVGLPKTGTSALQRYFYVNRERLAEHDVHWAETYPSNLHEINDWAHHVYSHKWGGWLDPQTFPVAPDGAWQALGDTMHKKPGSYLVSSERLADLLPLPVGTSVLHFIQDVIGSARLVVVGYVRRQDMLAESHLKELIKGGNLNVSLAEYLASPPSFLDFGRGFLTAKDAVGKENVKVRVYDRSSLLNGDIVADLLSVCNLPVVTALKNGGSETNPSLNPLAAKLYLDPRIAAAFHNQPYLRNYVKRLLSEAHFDALKEVSLFDAQSRETLMARYADGNRMLAEIFLSEHEAKALSYDSAVVWPQLDPDKPILNYNDLVEILIKLGPPMPADKS